MTQFRSAAVLGAGTMGAQIAAHLANAGVPVLLLDLDARTAAAGLERARALKPDPFFTRATARLVATGGFDADLPRLARCDWIVEAVVERLDAKRELLAQVETHCRADAVVSSNTSGIPLGLIAEGRSPEFRRRWLGTHFFNPPRYLALLEVIPTADTDPAVTDAVSRFADRDLGKGVVIARDTPGFIANRIGLYAAAQALELLASGRFTVEEIDALTGPAIGRPRSATFRTMDIAGLDILAHVARDLSERLDSEDERRTFRPPALVEQLVERGWTGQKAGQGFYRRERTPDGSRILTLDPATLDYRERQPPRLPALDAAAGIEDVRERVRALFRADGRVGELMRAALGRTLLYAAAVTPAIADSVDDVDRAMRWGFGWELGPFELWETLGVDTVLEACEVAEPPPLLRDLAAARGEPPPDRWILSRAKAARPVVRQNAGASLVDLGDGVLAVEFHSKANAIGGDTVEMLRLGVQEAEQNYEALVIGNDAAAFSAGANLMLILLEAEEQNWEEIDQMVRTFQGAVIGLLDADVPVVVAPAGLTLGGGCEIALHGDHVQAAAETYMGQVEVGVGLVPAGGGAKALLARAMAYMPRGARDPLPLVQQAFELIGFARVSTSAAEAKQLGLLRPGDGITMNRERLLADAKAGALQIARNGYRPPRARPPIPVGGEGVRASLELGVHLAWRGGRLSDHDALIGRKLANILAGGALPHPAAVSEQYLLDLEREAFLSLCGEARTRERMAHTLKTGKTLRN